MPNPVPPIPPSGQTPPYFKPSFQEVSAFLQITQDMENLQGVIASIQDAKASIKKTSKSGKKRIKKPLTKDPSALGGPAATPAQIAATKKSVADEIHTFEDLIGFLGGYAPEGSEQNQELSSLSSLLKQATNRLSSFSKADAARLNTVTSRTLSLFEEMSLNGDISKQDQIVCLSKLHSFLKNATALAKQQGLFSLQADLQKGLKAVQGALICGGPGLAGYSLPTEFAKTVVVKQGGLGAGAPPPGGAPPPSAPTPTPQWEIQLEEQEDAAVILSFMTGTPTTTFNFSSWYASQSPPPPSASRCAAKIQQEMAAAQAQLKNLVQGYNYSMNQIHKYVNEYNSGQITKSQFNQLTGQFNPNSPYASSGLARLTGAQFSGTPPNVTATFPGNPPLSPANPATSANFPIPVGSGSPGQNGELSEVGSNLNDLINNYLTPGYNAATTGAFNTWMQNNGEGLSRGEQIVCSGTYAGASDSFCLTDLYNTAVSAAGEQLPSGPQTQAQVQANQQLNAEMLYEIMNGMGGGWGYGQAADTFNFAQWFQSKSPPPTQSQIVAKLKAEVQDGQKDLSAMIAMYNYAMNQVSKYVKELNAGDITQSQFNQLAGNFNPPPSTGLAKLVGAQFSGRPPNMTASFGGGFSPSNPATTANFPPPGAIDGGCGEIASSYSALNTLINGTGNLQALLADAENNPNIAHWLLAGNYNLAGLQQWEGYVVDGGYIPGVNFGLDDIQNTIVGQLPPNLQQQFLEALLGPGGFMEQQAHFLMEFALMLEIGESGENDALAIGQYMNTTGTGWSNAQTTYDLQSWYNSASPTPTAAQVQQEAAKLMAKTTQDENAIVGAYDRAAGSIQQYVNMRNQTPPLLSQSQFSQLVGSYNSASPFAAQGLCRLTGCTISGTPPNVIAQFPATISDPTNVTSQELFSASYTSDGSGITQGQGGELACASGALQDAVSGNPPDDLQGLALGQVAANQLPGAIAWTQGYLNVAANGGNTAGTASSNTFGLTDMAVNNQNAIQNFQTQSSSAQMQLEYAMTQMNQEWTTVTSCMQTLNQCFTTVAQGMAPR